MPRLSVEELKHLPVKQIKEYLNAYHYETKGLTEKDELIRLLQQPLTEQQRLFFISHVPIKKEEPKSPMSDAKTAFENFFAPFTGTRSGDSGLDEHHLSGGAQGSSGPNVQGSSSQSRHQPNESNVFEGLFGPSESFLDTLKEFGDNVFQFGESSQGYPGASPSMPHGQGPHSHGTFYQGNAHSHGAPYSETPHSHGTTYQGNHSHDHETPHSHGTSYQSTPNNHSHSRNESPPKSPSVVPMPPHKEPPPSVETLIKQKIDPNSLSAKTLLAILEQNNTSAGNALEKQELVSLVNRLIQNAKMEQSVLASGDDDALCKVIQLT